LLLLNQSPKPVIPNTRKARANNLLLSYFAAAFFFFPAAAAFFDTGARLLAGVELAATLLVCPEAGAVPFPRSASTSVICAMRR